MGEMKERMLRGELYVADDPELVADNARAQELLDRYNATRNGEQAERDRLLRELLGGVGEGVVVKPSFRCDYGTYITIGARTFVNYDCVMLDVAPIAIGTACQLAPRVQLLTATHPVDPRPRRAGWESGAPIALGDNVWLGGGVVVGPGVTIGEDTVVGAGSVVTRDLPAGVVAFGVPARVQREIGETDRIDVPERGVSTPFYDVALNAGRLRELTEADLGDLQALLERCGDYYELHEERAPSPTEARDEWDALPDGTPRDRKHLLGLFAPELVGVVELICDWPRAGTWNIGLLLLEPGARRRRAGSEVLGAVDAAAARAGAATLRISVMPTNTGGMEFWRGLGFAPVPAVGSHPTAMALERVAGAR
jgi:maltose O-acetyltransferase